MATILTIAGVTIDCDLSHVTIDRLTHSLDRPDELEFTELNASLPGTWHPEQACTLTIDGTLEFSGWIVSRSVGAVGTGCPFVGYRCMGLTYGAYLVPVTASDSTGTIQFNVPRSSEDQYFSSPVGQSVGNILTTVFALHSTVLGTMGIATDATTATQLAALVVVPPEPVYFQGGCFWGQCEQILRQWYGSKYALWIAPTGKIRIYDTTTLGTQTLTLDSDPILLDGMNESTQECFTAVILRGAGDIMPYKASLSEGTLIDPNDPTPEATWTLYDFKYPVAGYSSGTITSQTSTTVTITSDSAAEHWTANYWSGISAEIGAVNPAITGAATLTGGEWKRVVSNTSLTAGGSSVITVDSAFANTGYTRYEVRGTPPGISECYRRYNFKWRYVAQHLVPKFPHSVFWNPSEGAGMSTLYPQSEVESATSSINASIIRSPRPFELVLYDGTTDGYVRFVEPTVVGLPGNTADVLAAGGGGVTRPSDVIVLVPYSRGALTAQAPASGYSGTAYTRFGIQRPLYRDYPGWVDRANLTDMTTLAGQILDTVSNVIQEGSITYFGKYNTALVGGSWPFAINLAKATGTTGYEAMAAPVRTMTLEWPQGGATPWVTRLSFSTRRQQYSGDRLYQHPAYAYAGGLFGGVQGMLAPRPMVAQGPGWDRPLGFTPVGAGQAGMGPLGVSPAGTAFQAPRGIEGQPETLTQAGQQAVVAKQQAAASQDLAARRAAQGVGPGGFTGQAGFGYEVAGTRAPDVSGVGRYFSQIEASARAVRAMPARQAHQQLARAQTLTQQMGTAEQFRYQTTGQRPKDWAD